MIKPPCIQTRISFNHLCRIYSPLPCHSLQWSSTLRSVVSTTSIDPLRRMSKTELPSMVASPASNTASPLTRLEDSSVGSYFPRSPLGSSSNSPFSSFEPPASRRGAPPRDSIHSAATALASLSRSPITYPTILEPTTRLPPISSFSLARSDLHSSRPSASISQPPSPTSTSASRRASIFSIRPLSETGSHPPPLYSPSHILSHEPITLPPIQDHLSRSSSDLTTMHSTPSLALPTFRNLDRSVASASPSLPPPLLPTSPPSATHLLNQLRRRSITNNSQHLTSEDQAEGGALDADSLMRRYSSMLKESLDSWEGLRDLVKDAEEVQCRWEGVRQSFSG